MAVHFKDYTFTEEINDNTKNNKFFVDLGELGKANYRVSIHRGTGRYEKLLYAVFMLNSIEIEYYSDLLKRKDYLYHTEFTYINTKAIHDKLCDMMIESRNLQPDKELVQVFKKLHDIGRGFVFSRYDFPTKLVPHTPGLFFNF